MSYNLIINGIITNNGEKTYTFRKDSQKIQWKEVFYYISDKSTIPIQYYNIRNSPKTIYYSQINPNDFIDIQKISYYDTNGKQTCNGLMILDINKQKILSQKL